MVLGRFANRPSIGILGIERTSSHNRISYERNKKGPFGMNGNNIGVPRWKKSRVRARSSGIVVCLKNARPRRRYGVKGAALPCGAWGRAPQTRTAKLRQQTLCGLIHYARDFFCVRCVGHLGWWPKQRLRRSGHHPNAPKNAHKKKISALRPICGIGDLETADV